MLAAARHPRLAAPRHQCRSVALCEGRGKRNGGGGKIPLGLSSGDDRHPDVEEFLLSGRSSANGRREKINDGELASRLSFFLWGSLPDEELFAVAQSGMLHDREALRTQLARMM